MSADLSTIRVIRGDDVALSLTFKDNDGDAIDITGYTVFFTVKEDKADADADAKISKTQTTHASPTTGESIINLSNSDTDLAEGSYLYDFQLKSPTGKINSTQSGFFEVVKDVTIRTT